MKLLLDENISWRLVSKLKQYFDEVEQINFIDISKPATDKEI
jgi:predicted nuclease of predicted toxin-antitoxin system